MRKKQSGAATVFILILFLLIGAVAIFYLIRNYKIEKIPDLQISTPPPTQAIKLSPTSKVSPDPSKPNVSTPAPSSKVTNPLVVKGVVPPGWMFEGVFPVKLLDDKRKLIAQGQGKETTPGSWQSGNPVDFEATITFSTTAKTGFLVLENDNPSGDPTKSKTFEISVNF